MQLKSAIFTGPKEKELPFSIDSKEYEDMKNKLKEEIADLIWLGVSEFYVGGQTGIDALCAGIVIGLREELYTTANLHLVIPYRGMEKEFNQRQMDEFDWIMENANSALYISDNLPIVKRLFYKFFNILPKCFKDRNRYMVKRSNYLLACLGWKEKRQCVECG